MKIDELIFPVTLEAFVAYQEAVMGLELHTNARKALAMWIPTVNQSYEDGQRSDTAALRDTIRIVNRFLTESEDCSALTSFLISARWWSVYAWKRGRKEAP